MSYKLVFKDAVWQIIGRIFSAIGGFIVLKLITPYLGPLRYGDYSTVLKYFVIWTALADLGLYVIAVKQLGQQKNQGASKEVLEKNYGKFVGTRIFFMGVVYFVSLCVAYLIPIYRQNLFIEYGLIFGLVYSALFMFAGILQLPLQIFWKMEKLSIALILARFVQISFLFIVIFVLFPQNRGNVSLFVFLLILFSVVLSGLTQNLYVYFTGKKYLKPKISFDKKFILSYLKQNGKYGLAYYLSSFHTLLVLILLSIFFPTSSGFEYTGIWALALSLTEILLIIPSALGNSFLHKISHLDTKKKLLGYGNFLKLIFFIGFLIFLNYTLFSKELILLIGSKHYLGNFQNPGSNVILPFLAFVLLGSYIKQTFNYIFVSTNNQNLLLPVNLFGIVFGLSFGLWAIPKFGIWGGVFTQLLLEFLYVLGAIYLAWKNGVLPIVKFSKIFYNSFLTAIIFAFFVFWVNFFEVNWLVKILLFGFLFNLSIFLLNINYLKETIKGFDV